MNEKNESPIECELTSINPEFDYAEIFINPILTKFKESLVVTDSDTISKIKSLSPNNLIRFEDISDNLIEANLLNQKTINDSIEKICDILPETNCLNIEENIRRLPNNKIMGKITLSSKLTFFTEYARESIDHGMSGFIRHGFDKDTADSEPTFLIKHFYLHAQSDKIKQEYSITLKMARHEVKYNRLFDRAANYYTDNKRNYMITDWLPGKPLSHYYMQFASHPIEKRIRWVESLLHDLNILHNNFRVHGDIKPKNMILNLENNSLKLIDFGSSRKAGSLKEFTGTPYVDDHLKALFSPDYFGICRIITELFPEFFHNLNVNTKVDISQNFTAQALVKLFKALNDKNEKKRCTVKDAFDFISQLLVQVNTLDGDKLLTLANCTINRQEITFEDAIHGHTCSRVKT